MNTATLDAREPVSVEVRWQRRTYPLPPSTAPPSTESIYELRGQDQETTLAERLAAALWERLPWSTLALDGPDRQSLVPAYVESLAVLERCQSDVQTLVRIACETSLESRQESGDIYLPALEAALAERLRETLDAVGEAMPPLPNVLQSPLVAQPAPILQTRLDEALRAATRSLTTNLFELFARLVDQEVFGLIEWHPNHCCSYHFFKRVVIQENSGVSVETQSIYRDEDEDDEEFEDEDDFGDGLVAEDEEEDDEEFDAGLEVNVIGRRTTRIVHGAGQHTHRLARHEHGVMNAIRTSIANTRVIMPPDVKRLVESIPDWLEPFVQIIDGQLFRERIIERDLAVNSWEDIEVKDEPIFGWEPAVIVGPYVLTGWGPREVALEQARRAAQDASEQDAEAERQARFRFPIFAATAGLLAIVSLLLFTLAHRGQASILVAVVATATTICAAWQAAFAFAVRERLPQPFLWTQFTTAAVSLPLLLAEWLIARWFVPLAWPTPVLLAVGAVVCLAIAKTIQMRPAQLR